MNISFGKSLAAHSYGLKMPTQGIQALQQTIQRRSETVKLEQDRDSFTLSAQGAENLAAQQSSLEQVSAFRSTGPGMTPELSWQNLLVAQSFAREAAAFDQNIKVETPEQIWNTFVQTTGFTGSTQEEFLQYMWKQNVSEDVDWKSVGDDFYVGYGANAVADKLTQQMTPDRLEAAIDFLASRYAYNSMKITEQYQGGEQVAAAKKLDELFTAGLTEFAADAAATYVDKLGKYGVGEGEFAKIRDGVTAAVQQQIGLYLDFAAANKDYAGILETENAWLADNGDYMAARLREAFAASGPQADKAPATSGVYTKADILGLGIMLNELAAAGHGIDANLPSDEWAGFYGGYMAMKAEATLKMTGATGATRDLLQGMVNSWFQDYLTAIDDDIKVFNSDSMVSHSEKPLNRSVAQAIYNLINDTFAKTGDIQSALEAGVSASGASFTARSSYYETNSPFRYEMGGALLQGLADGKAPNPMVAIGSYKSLLPNYTQAQRFNYDWERFTKALNLQKDDLGSGSYAEMVALSKHIAGLSYTLDVQA